MLTSSLNQRLPFTAGWTSNTCPLCLSFTIAHLQDGAKSRLLLLFFNVTECVLGFGSTKTVNSLLHNFFGLAFLQRYCTTQIVRWVLMNFCYCGWLSLINMHTPWTVLIWMTRENEDHFQLSRFNYIYNIWDTAMFKSVDWSVSVKCSFLYISVKPSLCNSQNNIERLPSCIIWQVSYDLW